MPLTAIIDSAYGDCGKARVVDLLAKDYDIVARFNGSSNCGHTIVHEDKKYLTRIMPSGFVYIDKQLVIAQGVLLDLEVFLDELKMFKEFHIMERLMISDKCHVLLPYHKAADARQEKETNNKIGSTKNGVAFCAEDKAGRRGIRVKDLFEEEEYWKKSLMNNIHHWGFISQETGKFEIYKDCCALIIKFIKIFESKANITDTGKLINNALDNGSCVLAESGQATFLDIESGYYPYVTSTPCTSAGVCLGMNVSPKALNKVIGITKAYVTRVGGGPFESELFDETGEIIRKVGNEFGSVTNRPRRVGWLNLDELKYANTVNGFDELFMSKVDVLNGLEKVKIMIDGSYVTLPGWSSYKDENFETYLKFVENFVGVPITMFSYGPERNEVVIRK